MLCHVSFLSFSPNTRRKRIHTARLKIVAVYLTSAVVILNRTGRKLRGKIKRLMMRCKFEEEEYSEKVVRSRERDRGRVV